MNSYDGHSCTAASMTSKLRGSSPLDMATADFIPDEVPTSPDEFLEGKSVVWNCLSPLAELFDQYATICDEVLSFFAHTFLRIIDFLNNMRSPFEVISGFIFSLPSFFFSLFLSILYWIFYVVTLPIRIFFNILFYHPLFFIVLLIVLLLLCIAVVAFIKKLSVVVVCRTGWAVIRPYIWSFTRSIIVIVFPQVGVFLNTVQLMLTPFAALIDLLTQLCHFLSPLRVWSNRKNRRRTASDASSPGGGRLSVTSRELRERMLCCVCCSREKSVLLQPCNHICLCAICTYELIDSDMPQCPLCRSEIISHVEVYI